MIKVINPNFFCAKGGRFNLLRLIILLLPMGNVMVRGQSAWLPEPSRWEVALSYTFETFDEFYGAGQKMDYPERIDQHTAGIFLDYGLRSNIALDLRLGYVRTTDKGRTEDGLMDTLIGLRWKLVDEFSQGREWMPSIALRLGGVIEGNYEVGFPSAVGDGASGFSGSLLFGKTFPKGFGAIGEVGYLWRNKNVPEEYFVTSGIFRRFGQRLDLSLSYRLRRSVSGLDIGGPGFTASRFPELKEIAHNLDFTFGWAGKSGRYYSFTLARTIDGLNTGDKTIVSLAASFSY